MSDTQPPTGTENGPTAMFVVEHRLDPEDRRWHSVYVPAIDQYTQARNHAEIEAMARDLIALCTGIPIERVGVLEYRVHKAAVDV